MKGQYMKRSTRKRISNFNDWEKDAWKSLMKNFVEAREPIDEMVKITIEVPLYIGWGDTGCDEPEWPEFFEALEDSSTDENEEIYESLIIKRKDLIQKKIDAFLEMAEKFAEKHDVDPDDILNFCEENEDIYEAQPDISVSQSK